MHNVNQSKRFKRSFSDVHAHGLHVPARGSPPDDDFDFVRHRRRSYPADTLRVAILLAVVVVTIVLYTMLWELERSSLAFAPVHNPSVKQSASGIWKATSTRHPHALDKDEPVLSLSEKSDKPTSEHILVATNSTSRSTPDTWLTPTTRTPEARQANTDISENEDKRLRSFDSAHCNGACRFLLPVRIGEQESKARIHFIQLVMLARRLGRTIVLPNVGKSRMSACSAWPFSVYYDTSVFARRDDSLNSWSTMDLEDFSKWASERSSPPSTFLVSLDTARHDSSEGPAPQEEIPFVVQRAVVDPKIVSCLGSKLGRLGSSLPETALSISFNSRSIKAAESDHASHALVHLLSSNFDVDALPYFEPMTDPTGYEYYYPFPTNTSHPSLVDADILIVDYDLRHPLFPADTLARVGPRLHYASALYDLADRLSDNLGPFVGVHWRMETVPVQNFAWCAASLVGTLHALLQDDGQVHHQAAGKLYMRHVWLATDYPRPLDLDLDSFLDHEDGRDQRTPGIISNAKSPTTRITQQPGDRARNKSSTFPVESLSSEHDDAIEMLVEAFQPGGDLEFWRLTDLAEQLRRYPYVEGRLDLGHHDDDGTKSLLDDPGVLGILDKLVVVQARVYVGGSTDCSKISSFSKQIIEARREMFEEGGRGAIRNVVEYFGKW